MAFTPTVDNPERASASGKDDFVVTFTAGANANFLRQDGTWSLPPGGGGGSSWGGITGTLSAQTDLQNALNLKANTSSLAAVATSGAYSSLSGLPTLGTLAALSYPGGTSSFLRADGTWAVPVDVNANWGNISGTLSAQTDLNTALGLKAPLASPTFTGTPAAPTAAVSTNTTQLATTAFVLGQAGSATPLINGTATSGASLLYTRQDHVHPVDTSRMSNTVMTTAGDIIVGGVSGAPGRLAIGSVGNVLTIAAGPTIAWSAPVGFANPLTTLGDVFVGGASGAASRLGIGSTNQVLTVVSGAPAWAAAVGFANPMTTSQDLIVGGAAGAAGRLAVGSNGQFLQVSAGSVVWGAGGLTNPMTTSQDLIVGGTSGAPGRLAVGANGTVLGVTAGSVGWVASLANPMTAIGDIIIGGTSGAATRLAIGSTNAILAVISGNPSWITSPYAPIASPTFTGTVTIPSGASISGFAPLASPTFTGTPAAPTATAGTNTTQLATTAFVATSFAPLASPTLTGTPAAPTAAALTNTTQIATTAFVQQEKKVTLTSESIAYTAVLADGNNGILHPAADTTARTFTIPANSSVAYPVGTSLLFVNQNAAGVVTIAITTDTMRLAGAGTTGSRTLAANGIATALKITSTEWIINGTGLT